MPHRPVHSPRDEALHALGLKVTLPRLRVLEVFQREQASRRHLTAEDVYRQLLDGGSDVGLATVYRVLMQFVQAGLLIRQHFEGDKAVFELNEGHHHDHLVCVVCGRVEEFHDPAIETRQEELAKARGFELRAHALALYGVCSDEACRGRQKPADSQ
ncbi:MAG: ferric iron uptake transcriptional regulator [Burkholderiales bacterium]|nr:ferric iron uptake transcriptional regulator [Burkholderiales bacterium]